MKHSKTILIFSIGIITCASLFLLSKNNSESNRFFVYLSGAWILLAGLLIFIANSVLNLLLDKVLNWKRFAILRFFTQMILGTGLSLLFLNISYHYLKSQFTQAAPDSQQLLLMNIYGAALILPIFAMVFGFKFLKAWRKLDIESVQLQKENARSQMMTLRNHLDPHFLFNNLNILSSLMDKDQELSKNYLDKFAEVYRVILKTEVSDLTTVRDELSLIESYLYLLKIRFEGCIEVIFKIDDHHKDMAIPPLAIQMLLENVIKHNVLEVNDPVVIKIASEGSEYLSIKNNKKIKKYTDSKRNGTGIENIKSRYHFFSEKEVIVSETNETFEVKIPLLEIEDY